jgi:hypothetical protein
MIMAATGGSDEVPPSSEYPLSLKRRPKGVSSGKAVWQAAQGWPVCLAKLGTACAGRGEVIKNETKINAHANTLSRAHRLLDDISVIPGEFPHSRFVILLPQSRQCLATTPHPPREAGGAQAYSRVNAANLRPS